MFLMSIKSGVIPKWKTRFDHFSAPSSRIKRGSCSYSSLLSGYLQDGKIQDAERVFELMPVKKVVEWSIMVHGYAKHGLYSKSVNLFTRMTDWGIVPNSFTFVGVLVSSAGLRDSVLCQSLHGLILKCGCHSNLIVNTALLDAYAKSGNLQDSYQIFQDMSCPNLVSWSAMIAGFFYNELFHEGFMLFKHFQRSGNTPNDAMILTLAKGCAAVESQMLSESIHGLTEKMGFHSSLAVNNAILSVYSSLTNVRGAQKLFGSMECKDIVSWTTIMGLLVRLEYALDAVAIFCQVRFTGLIYDPVILLHVLLACRQLGALKMGRSVHAQVVVRGFQCELPVTNSLISMYSRCGDLDSSRTIFKQAPLKNVVSFTSMILGCVENGQPREALGHFIRVRAEEDYLDDRAILLSTLTAAGQVAHLDLCQQIHCYITKAGFQSHRSIQNTLISIYSKSGNIEYARSVFEQMGCLRDVVSWNVLINGYGINGCGETAVVLFHKMRKSKENPDGATYLSVLTACSHSGLIRDGFAIFKQMVDEDLVRPSQEHYGCVADLLARAGYVSDTNEAVDEVVDSHIWKALINGCLLHGNIKLAEVAAMRLLKEGVIEPGQLVLLANLYASVGRFQDAEAIRLNMDFIGLDKDPGFSFLTGNSYEAG